MACASTKPAGAAACRPPPRRRPPPRLARLSAHPFQCAPTLPTPIGRAAERRGRPAAAAAAAADAPSSLTPNRDRYHVIELAGCELLVASTPDGRLDVGDAYVRDGASGLYARPGGDGLQAGGPSALAAAWGGPRPAVVVPWETTFFGDALFKKAGWTRMDRVFLIPALASGPFTHDGGGGGGGGGGDDGPPARPTLDFTAVAAFDAETRVLELATVKREAPAGVDPARLSLRIRAEGLILVETDALPTPGALVAAQRGQ